MIQLVNFGVGQFNLLDSRLIMKYCIVFNPTYIIGPFDSIYAALDYVDDDPTLDTCMIQVMQTPIDYKA